MKPENPAIAAQRSIDAKLRHEAQSRLDMQARAVHYERKGDGLDWARRIVARLEAGERLGMLPEQWAREALALPAERRQPGQDDEELPHSEQSAASELAL